METLEELVKQLKQHLGANGDYAICRTNGEPLDGFEALMLGSLFEKIDKILDEGSE